MAGVRFTELQSRPRSYWIPGSFETSSSMSEPSNALPRFRGIRLRRDNWVSVRYAEELNSGKSSVTPQRTDRHGILGEKLTDLQVSL